MQQFAGKLAVITGGGHGMGQTLARQLSAEGCHVAMCDVSQTAMDDTVATCLADAPAGTVVSCFVADVSDESQLQAFRDHVLATHSTDHIDLLFNNAGVGGGGSMIADSRDEWDRTFGICWGGVYYGTRTFLPLLVASTEAHIVNTSSVNGFWACLGPENPHTAYSTAKFAVKGFTEALIIDLRLNAPHVKASVVMPGHIGTSIAFNTGAAHGRHPKDLTDADIEVMRDRFAKRGIDTSGASNEDIKQLIIMQAQGFLDNAPMTAAEAATVILDGVRAGEWRILVGADAHVLDGLVRANPTEAYEPEFVKQLQARGAFANMPVGDAGDR